MSSNLTSIFPPGISLTGGIPIKSQDLGASVIFTMIYLVIFPLAVWRLVASSSRCFALVRPTAFALARIITFVIRAIQADGHYSKGLFIAEQTPPDRAHRRSYPWYLCRLSVVERQFHDFFDDANAVICLIVTILSGVVAAAAQVKETPSLPPRSTVYLVAVSALLTISSAYRLFLYEHSPSPNPVGSGTKAAFYIFSSIPEMIVSILYVSLNLNVAFDIPEGRRKEKAIKEMKKGTYTGGEWNVESQNTSVGNVGYPPERRDVLAYTAEGYQWKDPQQMQLEERQGQQVHWQQRQ
ncbi:hypothetical protein T439DRAFT_384601 [Meredithblackwellia eburnea MCA 4105]